MSVIKRAATTLDWDLKNLVRKGGKYFTERAVKSISAQFNIQVSEYVWVTEKADGTLMIKATLGDSANYTGSVIVKILSLSEWENFINEDC